MSHLGHGTSLSKKWMKVESLQILYHGHLLTGDDPWQRQTCAAVRICSPAAGACSCLPSCS